MRHLKQMTFLLLLLASVSQVFAGYAPQMSASAIFNINGYEVIHSMNPTSDGGYLFAGHYLTSYLTSSMLIIKTDSRLNEIWRAEYTAIPDAAFTDYSVAYAAMETALRGKHAQAVLLTAARAHATPP